MYSFGQTDAQTMVFNLAPTYPDANQAQAAMLLVQDNLEHAGFTDVRGTVRGSKDAGFQVRITLQGQDFGTAKEIVDAVTPRAGTDASRSAATNLTTSQRKGLPTWAWATLAGVGGLVVGGLAGGALVRSRRRSSVMAGLGGFPASVDEEMMRLRRLDPYRRVGHIRTGLATGDVSVRAPVLREMFRIWADEEAAQEREAAARKLYCQAAEAASRAVLLGHLYDLLPAEEP